MVSQVAWNPGGITSGAEIASCGRNLNSYGQVLTVQGLLEGVKCQ